jgi:hypothetical protein
MEACRRFHAKIKTGLRLERELLEDREAYEEEKRGFAGRSSPVFELVIQSHAGRLSQ